MSNSDNLNKYIELIDNEWECPICFNNLESDQYIIFPFNCGHSYCYTCIKTHKLLANKKLKCYLCFSTNKKLKIPFKNIYPAKQEDEVRKRAALKVVETEYERVVELSSDATNKYAALEKFEYFWDKMGYH